MSDPCKHCGDEHSRWTTEARECARSHGELLFDEPEAEAMLDALGLRDVYLLGGDVLEACRSMRTALARRTLNDDLGVGDDRRDAYQDGRRDAIDAMRKTMHALEESEGKP